MNSPPLNSSKKNRKKKKKKTKSSSGANVDAGLDKVQNGTPECCTSPTCAGTKADSSSETQPWKCSECNVECSLTKSSSPQVLQCTCPSCMAGNLRDTGMPVDGDMSSTQSYWMEIRHIVRNIYRSTNSDDKPAVSTEKMKSIVKRLCRGDPHQFFQRLETLAREYLLEVKVRLLEQLSLGFNSPQLAISFIEMLLDEYFILADALPSLYQLLQPLEEAGYVDNLKLTVDLMNKNIFRELIFAESFMSSNLPLIIAQLRLTSLSSDAHHCVMAEKLNQKYNELDQEMEEVGHLWRVAKTDFPTFPPSIPIDQSKKAHIEEIRSDAESLRKMKQQQKQQSKSQDLSSAKAVSKMAISQVVKPPSEEPKPFSACGITNTQLCSKMKPLESVQLDDSGRTLKPTELSTILYHCMKPIGEPDTVLTGDRVMQTYTLKLELSKLDLSKLPTESHLSDNDRYKDFGLSVEEMNDINLKLNALKAMGLDLQLEDLLDTGVSLVEQNRVGMNGLLLHNNGKNHLHNGTLFEGFSKMMNGEKERGEVNGTMPKPHAQFDGLVLKLRVTKRLSRKELENYRTNGPVGLQFSSQDEAQLQVARLELNHNNVSVHGDCVGVCLGLEKECEDPMDSELFNSARHYEVVRVLQQQLDQCSYEKDSVEALKSRGVVLSGKAAASKCEKLEKAEKALAKDSDSSKVVANSPPSDVDLSKLKPLIVPSTNTSCQCAVCVGARAATTCNHSDTQSTVMHSVHKIQLTPGHNFIALAQEKPSKPLRPGESPKTHLLHYKLDSKEVQQSPNNGGGVGGATTNGDHSSCNNNHSTSHGDSGYEEDSSSLESSKSSAQHSPDCDSCHHHHHHHHHNNHHHGHHHHGHQHCNDTTSSNDGGHTSSGTVSNSSSNTTTDSSMEDGHHTKLSTNGSSSTSKDNGGGGTTSTSNTTSGGGGGNSGRTYCRCCYCELFGHSGPPTAPTSHNYTKQRDKMRVKLEMKKQRDTTTVTNNHDHSCACSNYHPSNNNNNSTTSIDAKDDRSLDTLLEFINGPEEENQKMSSRAAKRQRRKQRKQENNQHEDDGDAKYQEISLLATTEGDDNKGQQSPDEEKEMQESSDEEQEKIKNGVLSDHSSDEMEVATEIMMQRSLSQEFTLINGKIAALQKLEKQHQEREKMQAKMVPVNDTQSTNGTTAANNSSGVKSQTHNQKMQQQQQQQVVQKTRPATTATSTTTNKPTEGQYTTMTSRRQQQQQQQQQQQMQQAKDMVDNGQKYYSGEHNTRPPPQQRQITKDKDTMTGRDSRDTRYHYAPNPNRIKQLPPRFQRMAQEQLANQQQQQQQYSRPRYTTQPAYSQSISAPAGVTNNTQATVQRKESAGHTVTNSTTLDDVFMPKDDAVNTSDGEMDEIDRELEEFKRFCFMNKPLENRPKVAVKVNLKDLTLKKT